MQSGVVEVVLIGFHLFQISNFLGMANLYCLYSQSLILMDYGNFAIANYVFQK